MRIGGWFHKKPSLERGISIKDKLRQRKPPTLCGSLEFNVSTISQLRFPPFLEQQTLIKTFLKLADWTRRNTEDSRLIKRSWESNKTWFDQFHAEEVNKVKRALWIFYRHEISIISQKQGFFERRQARRKMLSGHIKSGDFGISGSAIFYQRFVRGTLSIWEFKK